MSTPGCPFCEIFEGHAPPPKKYTLYDRGLVASFEPLNPRVPGHLLFVPTQHRQDASAHPGPAGRAFTLAAQHAAEMGTPFNMITSGGRAASQTVFHTHIHYLPRAENDGVELPWPH